MFAKAIEMFRQVHVEVLAVVENMSTFKCRIARKRIDIFGHGEGAKTAKENGVPVLGEIESIRASRNRRDTGKPVATLGEDSPSLNLLRHGPRHNRRLDEVRPTSGAPRPID